MSTRKYITKKLFSQNELHLPPCKCRDMLIFQWSLKKLILVGTGFGHFSLFYQKMWGNKMGENNILYFFRKWTRFTGIILTNENGYKESNLPKSIWLFPIQLGPKSHLNDKYLTKKWWKKLSNLFVYVRLNIEVSYTYQLRLEG